MEITYEMLPGTRTIAPRLIPDEDGPVTWEFICPLCLKKWETPFYKEYFLQSCPTCRAKLPDKRHNQDPWMPHFEGSLNV